MVIPGATVFLSSGCIVTLAIVVFGMATAELGASSDTWTAVLATALVGVAVGSFLGDASRTAFILGGHSRCCSDSPPRPVCSR